MDAAQAMDVLEHRLRRIDEDMAGQRGVVGALRHELERALELLQQHEREHGATTRALDALRRDRGEP